MPLKLFPPRQGWSPYWRIRGTYLGCYVNRGARTEQRALAEKIRKKLERDIESGALARKTVTGFAAAAAAYMKAGGDNRFMGPLIKHFTHTPLEQIDQVMIDNAAAEIYPNASIATRNRQGYTPMVAGVRRAGIDKRFKRPKGWQSPKSVSW